MTNADGRARLLLVRLSLYLSHSRMKLILQVAAVAAKFRELVEGEECVRCATATADRYATLSSHFSVKTRCPPSVLLTAEPNHSTTFQTFRDH